MSLVRKWATLRRQSAAVRRRVPAATTALVWVAFLLRIRGFARAQRQLSRTGSRGSNALSNRPEEIIARARESATAVTLVARNLPGQPRCLTRSLSLWWLLQRQGIDARLCVGVRPLNGTIEAHAWVSWQDTVINDRADIGATYLAFDGDIAAIAEAVQGDGGSVDRSPVIK